MFIAENDIKARVEQLTGTHVWNEIIFCEDTSNYMKISRGEVLLFGDEQYYVLGNMYEGRFTLDDYPKYWVKSAIELSTGKKKILKWKFEEEVLFKVGDVQIKCQRNSEKESAILKLGKGNFCFMQGETFSDSQGNPVKIIDYIKGDSFYNYLSNLTLDHQIYFSEIFPGLLSQLKELFIGLQIIHRNNYVHGDIRNDHIFMDNQLKVLRWIDFDLEQDFSDFDIWSIGNILLYAVGMGEHTFANEARKKSLPLLTHDDASAFMQYRIINLKKLFPYIPENINSILMRFSKNTSVFYDNIGQIIEDLEETLDTL